MNESPFVKCFGEVTAPRFCAAVLDEQNAHTEATKLPSPLEFRKDSEEENRDSEKDEDTKELEAVTCERLTETFSDSPHSRSVSVHTPLQVFLRFEATFSFKRTPFYS